MPTVSALDPSVRYDDQDAEQAQMRARNQDFMMRQWLQNQQMQAQQGMQQNQLGAQERMFGRDLADRAAGRTAQYGMQQLAGNQAMDLARLNQGPQAAALDFMKQKYADERGDSAGTRNFQNALSDYKLQALRGVLGGEQTANGAINAGFKVTDPQGYEVAKFDSGGGMSMADRDRRAMMFGLLGLNAPTDPEEQAQEFARKLIAARMANADESDLGKYAEAFKSGNLGAIPVREKSLDPGMLSEALASQAKDFGERDIAMIGSNPTEMDVQAIVQRRDQLARSLMARERLPEDLAKQQANLVIEQQVAPMNNVWFGRNEMLKRLREALNGVASPPAYPQSGNTGMVGNLPIDMIGQ